MVAFASISASRPAPGLPMPSSRKGPVGGPGAWTSSSAWWTPGDARASWPGCGLEAVGDGTSSMPRGSFGGVRRSSSSTTLPSPVIPMSGDPRAMGRGERLLAAGIEVVARRGAGRGVVAGARRERLIGEPAHRPRPFLRDADQVQLVDIPPQALRRRLAHGGLYGPEDIDAVGSAGVPPDPLAACVSSP